MLEPEGKERKCELTQAFRSFARREIYLENFASRAITALMLLLSTISEPVS